MRCPRCDHPKSRVVTTRRVLGFIQEDQTQRYRKCLKCGKQFKTFECYEPADVEAAFKMAEALDILETAKQKIRPSL